MIIQQRPPLHLTYCLNVHPGESWAENLAALKEKTLSIKQAVAPGQWFGAGLRIAHRATEELTNSAELRAEALEQIAVLRFLTGELKERAAVHTKAAASVWRWYLNWCACTGVRLMWKAS